MTMAFIDAYNRRDYDVALENCDPEVDWILPEHQASDSGKGHDDIRRFFDGLDETFDDLRLLPQEFVDGRIVRIEYLTTWPAALEAAGLDLT